LLADEGFDLSQTIQMVERHASSHNASDPALTGTALLEPMVRNLDRSPQRLDHLEALIRELRQQPDANALFPIGFDQIWDPIWAARQKLR